MTDQSFFAASSEQSQIKTRIVAKYFWAWAKVVIPSAKSHGNRIAYVDLFAGPGRYKDGTISTPLLILEKAIADADMRRMLVTVLNDKDKENSASLAQSIDELEGVGRLSHRPQVRSEEVGGEIVRMFEKIRFVPTLFFVDPWGYKGLSLALMNSVLKHWGCDCIFFFNYNRINMGLNNPIVREHMNDLFGEDRAGSIREKLAGLKPEEREALIIEELSRALQQLGANYVLPFGFKNERGTRTTHHLILATKSFKGYEIMKEIMAAESSEQEQGVPSFEYSPASKNFPLLFALSRPLDDLEDALVRDFAGRQMTMGDVYLEHSVGKPYVRANYKKAFTHLESAGKIDVTPAAERRPKRGGKVTFADRVVVRFPRGPENEP